MRFVKFYSIFGSFSHASLRDGDIKGSHHIHAHIFMNIESANRADGRGDQGRGRAAAGEAQRSKCCSHCLSVSEIDSSDRHVCRNCD